MKITREFCPGCRYQYDLLLLKKGYAQVDTGQDAEYFGTWANPTTLVIFNYCEGDCTTTECETAQEFIEELERIKQWNIDNGHRFLGVDPGLDKLEIQNWHNIGASHLLH